MRLLGLVTLLGISYLAEARDASTSEKPLADQNEPYIESNVVPVCFFSTDITEVPKFMAHKIVNIALE
jgi:hypothetical protein